MDAGRGRTGRRETHRARAPATERSQWMSNVDKQGGKAAEIDLSQFFQVFFDECA